MSLMIYVQEHFYSLIAYLLPLFTHYESKAGNVESTNFISARSFIHIATSVQFIIKSLTSVDVGFRKAIINSN